jgi:hypothetical protein
VNGSIDRLRQATLALAVLGAAVAAFAYSFIINDSQPQPNGTGLPVKWDAGTVSLRLLLGDTANLSDGTSYNSSARAAAQTWTDLLGTVALSTTTATGNPGSGNGLNELAFSDKIFGRDFEENTLAVTTGRQSGNQRLEADIIFNTARTWDSYRGNQRAGSVDIQRVALHELGHLLGLDHPDENSQQVDAIMNSRIGNRDALSQDDIEGARQLYGSKTVPANDAFANATTITGTPFSGQGANTLATKEAGEPNHADNAGGHSVWWKWTPTAGGSAKLDTRGSYYDTTLAVYTGTALSALTRLVADDDVQDGVVQASEVTFTATAGTTYHIAVDGFDGDTGGIRLALSVDGVTGSPPVISDHPLSITRTVGQAAGFSVSATGTNPFTYQWQFNGNPITGATNNTFSILSVATADAGSYNCVVTNALGSATSNTATLTVNTPPPPSSGGGGGGGGGGGAPSAWFVVALALLAAVRGLKRR